MSPKLNPFDSAYSKFYLLNHLEKLPLPRSEKQKKTKKDKKEKQIVSISNRNAALSFSSPYFHCFPLNSYNFIIMNKLSNSIHHDSEKS